MVKEIKPMSGWLGFFIFTLLVTNPIFNAFFLYVTSEFFFDYIEGVASISLCILAGVFLLKKKPYAVKFAKVFLATTFIANTIFFLVGWDDSGLIGFPYFILWFWFLSVSKQVKSIFGPLKEQQNGMQVWPKLAIIYAFFSPLFGMVFSVVALLNISKNRRLKGLWLAVGGMIISIVIFFGLILYGAILYPYDAYYEYEIPESVSTQCNDYCYEEYPSSLYVAVHNTLTENYECYCLDQNEVEVGYTEWPASSNYVPSSYVPFPS